MNLMNFFRRSGAESTVPDRPRDRADDSHRRWLHDRENDREKQQMHEYMQRIDQELADIAAHSRAE